jgi:hypothetical protein
MYWERPCNFADPYGVLGSLILPQQGSLRRDLLEERNLLYTVEFLIADKTSLNQPRQNQVSPVKDGFFTARSRARK